VAISAATVAFMISCTLLTGGAGYVFLNSIWSLIFGTIQSFINFQGSLSAWWTRIAIGFLVFVFCLLQRFFEMSR
jgi:simple sugar transport system permease protein